MISYGSRPIACSRPYAAYISTSAEVIGGTQMVSRLRTVPSPKSLLYLGFQPSAMRSQPDPQPESAENDRRPDQDRNEPLVGLDDPGRQIPGRQIGVPGTESQGHGRGTEETDEQCQCRSTDDAEQGELMVAVPDSRADIAGPTAWPDYRVGACAWPPSSIHACLPRSRLNTPDTPPESFRSLSPAWTRPRAAKARVTSRNCAARCS